MRIPVGGRRAAADGHFQVLCRHAAAQRRRRRRAPRTICLGLAHAPAQSRATALAATTRRQWIAGFSPRMTGRMSAGRIGMHRAMSLGLPPRTTLPLWPLPLLAALLPFAGEPPGLVAVGARRADPFLQSVLGRLRVDQPRRTLRPGQPPVPDGDAAVRDDPGVVLAGRDAVAAAAMRRCAARVLPWLGLAAGVFLGTVRHVPRQRRRGLPGAAPLWRVSVLRLQLPGVAAGAARAVAASAAAATRIPRRCWRSRWDSWRWAWPRSRSATRWPVQPSGDRWENVLEWHVGLWLTAMFAVLAWCWWRERCGCAWRLPDATRRPARGARKLALPCADQFQLSTTLPALPDSIRSKPFWKSSIGSWCVSTLPSGKPPSTSCVILYQVSYILRP